MCKGVMYMYVAVEGKTRLELVGVGSDVAVEGKMCCLCVCWSWSVYGGVRDVVRVLTSPVDQGEEVHTCLYSGPAGVGLCVGE